MKKQQATGFTLIELMIVVVIVSILVAIAYPTYVDQIRKSRRADCAGVLTGLAAAMERKFTVNSTYTGLADGANAPLSAFYPAKCPTAGAAKYYDLVIDSTTTSTTYLIKAIRAGDQVSDQCGDLTLTHTGVKGLENNGAARTVSRCW